jgi:phosphoserine phosphatase RsbU/P
MKSKAKVGLYVLLFVVIAFSMGYYIAGTLALWQEFFHASRYADGPFDLGDDGQTLRHLHKEATAAGLADGDFLLALNRAPFTGEAQLHNALRETNPGNTIAVSVRRSSGKLREAQVRLEPRKGPGWSIGGYIAFLAPILGVPLLGLLIGYWVVAVRPHDLNAWLVLLLLSFPETAFGNLDWSFWGEPWYILLGLWNVVVQEFVFPALLWFGFLFPERWRVDFRLPWIKYAILAASCCAFVLDIGFLGANHFYVQAIHPLSRVQTWTNPGEATLNVTCILLFLAAMFDKLRSSSTADARRRLRVLAIGSALSLGPLVVVFTVLPWFGIDTHHGRVFLAAVPAISLFSLTLAYVLIVQRAMDVSVLLRMGTRYLLARATVLTAEVALVAFLILRLIVPMIERREHPFLNFLLLALCIAALFQVFVLRGSLTQRFQRWLDRKFFREAYNSEVLLSELSEQVRRVTDKNALFEIILQRISEVLHVSQISILLRGSNVFHLQQALGIDFGGPVALREDSATIQNLARTNQPATVYRDRPEEWFEDAGIEEKAVLREINAELLLPMSGRADLLGLIALGPKKSEEPYTPTDLRMLQSVAVQTGLTLEVAELVRTLADQAAHRERMNREIEIAREVQQRLFPQDIPCIPGVDLAGRCRPALEVGGDYYDLIEMEAGHLGFAIGDVSGKGISAALIMASLRASLRGLILDDPGDLARMMQKVSHLVYEASSSSRYATFFFATLNPRTREFRYVNAGHNPPVLVKQASGTLQRLEDGGPVVGMLPFADYEAQSVTLEPGDLLIAYTDGISEAMTAADEEWGESRMLAAIPPQSSASALEVLNGIFLAADAFTAGAEQHDDMTLLVMRVKT